MQMLVDAVPKSGAAFVRMLARAAGSLAQVRARTPSETLSLVAPHLPACGITRAASVTGLDTLGIPTWVAIRPNGLVLQVSNGKGLTDAAAQASAVMEAIELHHAEHPLAERLVTACAEDLRASLPPGARLVPPQDLPAYLGGYSGSRFLGEWTGGRDMVSGAPVWVPSSAVYFLRRPSHHETSSNGLASGNTADEAALHALYELIERDAMCRIRENGRLRIRERARVVDPESISEPVLQAIVRRCHEVETKVVLVALPSVVPVHSFWAVFLGTSAIASVSTVNVGWGCHANPAIAAARALTEAAQSRLGFIHGGRDDVIRKPVHTATAVKSSPAYRFFSNLRADCHWRDIIGKPMLPTGDDPGEAVSRLVMALTKAAVGPLIRFDLTSPTMKIPVVRIVCSGLAFDKVLF
jgi:ribosomal protein S12 methylthiotransferase accessory factor